MATNSKDILHVGRPNLGDLDVFQDQLKEIFDRRWLTNNGQVVQEFERRLQDYLDVKHCIAVCNGTTGLQLACRALDLSGEVITSPYTFLATPHAMLWEGIKPVFADIDPATHNLCPTAVEAAITDQTTAILGVHLWGRACQPEALQSVATEHNIPLFFDAAHAFGCAHNGKMIGNFGRCEVFSFHATKFFNTCEGGAIATNDDHLAAKLRQMKNFGFANSGKDEVAHLGINGKMSEVHAAMGLACFEQIDEFLTVNRNHYNRYHETLSKIPGIRFLEYDGLDQANWQYIVIEVDQAETGVSRDQVMDHLHQKGILARRYFHPGCHRIEPYCSLYPAQVDRFPATDELCEKVLLLPTGTSVTDADVDRVCSVISQRITA